MVIVLLLIPASVNQNDKVEKIRNMGIPDEKPKNNIIIARRSKKAVKELFHPFDSALIRFLFSINYKCAYSNPSYNCFQDSLCNQFCFGDKNGKFA
jgi:hypothetical protein